MPVTDTKLMTDTADLTTETPVTELTAEKTKENSYLNIIASDLAINMKNVASDYVSLSMCDYIFHYFVSSSKLCYFWGCCVT